jgi:hypothetical protein
VFAADIDGSVQEIAKYYGTVRPPLIELPLQKIAKPSSAASFEQLLALHKNNTPVDIWPNWYLSADEGKDSSALAMALALLPGTFIYEPGTELQTPNASGNYPPPIFENKISYKETLYLFSCFCCDAKSENRQGSAFNHLRRAGDQAR